MADCTCDTITTTGDMLFKTGSPTATEKMRLTSDGKLGIGTTPRGLLHAVKDATDELVLNQEPTTNLVPNPSFETGVANWNSFGSGSTITQVSTQKYIGYYSAQASVVAAAYDRGVQSAEMPVSPNTTYALSGRLRVPVGLTKLNFTIIWRDAAHAFISGPGVTVVPTGDWQYVFLTATSPANAAYALIQIWIWSGNNDPNAWTWQMDAMQFEQKAYATPYCDGSLGPGYSWSGSPHASTSIRQAGAAFMYQSLNVAGGLGAVARGGAAALRIEQDGTGPIVQVFDTATEVFRVADGGAVGIGVVPSEKLDVNGNIKASGNLTVAGQVGIGITSPTTINSGAAIFALKTPKTEILTGTDTGTYEELVTIRHTGIESSPVPRRVGLLLKLSNEQDANETRKMGGLVLDSSNAWANSPSLHLVTDNTKRVTVDFNGLVGIGTTTPGEKLEVSGNIKVSGGGKVIVGGRDAINSQGYCLYAP